MEMRAVLWVALALLTGNCNAQASIELLDQHYSTSVTALSTGLDGSVRKSSSLTSTSTPLSDEVVVPPQSPYSSEDVYARASAGPLAVSTSALAHYGGAEATAESLLSFKVLSATEAPLTVNFTWIPIPNVNFSASLQDLTLDETVFSFTGFGSFGGISGFVPSIAFAPLVEAHTYALHLYSRVSEDADPAGFSIQVGGLYPIAAAVPEPDAWAMILVGLVAVGGFARRRQLQPRRSGAVVPPSQPHLAVLQ